VRVFIGRPAAGNDKKGEQEKDEFAHTCKISIIGFTNSTGAFKIAAGIYGAFRKSVQLKLSKTLTIIYLDYSVHYLYICGLIGSK
jgi:hypothetical protein